MLHYHVNGHRAHTRTGVTFGYRIVDDHGNTYLEDDGYRTARDASEAALKDLDILTTAHNRVAGLDH